MGIEWTLQEIDLVQTPSMSNWTPQWISKLTVACWSFFFFFLGWYAFSSLGMLRSSLITIGLIGSIGIKDFGFTIGFPQISRCCLNALSIICFLQELHFKIPSSGCNGIRLTFSLEPRSCCSSSKVKSYKPWDLRLAGRISIQVVSLTFLVSFIFLSDFLLRLITVNKILPI